MNAVSSIKEVNKYSIKGYNKIEVAKRICALLFYCSLIVLIATYFFSSHFIILTSLFISVMLGLALLLSYKDWHLQAIYIINLSLLGSLCVVVYQESRFDISSIFFILLLVSNRVLLKDTLHFWVLTTAIVFASLVNVFIASTGVNDNGYIAVSYTHLTLPTTPYV